MEILKYIILFFIFGTTSFIGILISKKYSNRVKELQERYKNISKYSKEKVLKEYKTREDGLTRKRISGKI